MSKQQVYLSFCDTDKPRGSQFLGAIVLEADDVVEAVRKAHELKINPGGEVLGILVPGDKRVPKQFCDKLLTEDEAKSLPYVEV